MQKQSKGGGARKIGRHARVVVKDTILRDETGAAMSHMRLVNRLVAAGPFMHGPQQKRQKRSH